MKQTHMKEEDSGSWIAWIVRDSSIATTDPLRLLHAKKKEQETQQRGGRRGRLVQLYNFQTMPVSEQGMQNAVDVIAKNPLFYHPRSD